MIHMRQPFFSIANSVIYIALGMVFGIAGTAGHTVQFGTLVFDASALWALTGIMFLMAYFSLVHIREK